MTVLGADNRTAVGNTTASPYSAVVLVKVDFDGDGTYEAWGSGAVISDNDVLTAAHVIWDPAYGYAKNVQVVPAASGGSAPFGTVQATGLHVADGYVAVGGDLNLDFGVINLGVSIGSATGTFSLSPAADAYHHVGKSVTTAGYPGDWSANASVMATASGEIAGRRSGLQTVYGDSLDTFSGQSGSPLWTTVNGQASIVTVHTAGWPTYNSGTAITNDAYNVIAGWSGGDTRTSLTTRTTNYPDSVAGTDTADLITGNSLGNRLLGNRGNDVLLGYDGDDVLYGNIGSDLLSGGNGWDTIYGGQNDGPAGTDGVWRTGTETLVGGEGRDILYGNHGDDYLYGENGDDALYGGQDADILIGGSGYDRLAGNLGNDFLSGGDGRDTLQGGAGDDMLVGGGDLDRLSGGDGNDLLYGDGVSPSTTNPGWDYIDGGAGEDTAVYMFARSNYMVTRADDGAYYVNSWEVLRNVEYLRFSDTIAAIDSLV